MGCQGGPSRVDAEGELSQAAPWGRGSTHLECFGVGCLEGVRSGARRAGRPREGVGGRAHPTPRLWLCSHGGVAWSWTPGCLTLGPEPGGTWEAQLLCASRSCPGATTLPCCLPPKPTRTGRGEGQAQASSGPQGLCQCPERFLLGRPPSGAVACVVEVCSRAWEPWCSFIHSVIHS